MVATDDDRSIRQQLEEVWAIVDELGELSLRLSRAAEAAVTKLRIRKHEEGNND